MTPNGWSDNLQQNLKAYFLNKGFTEEELAAQLNELGDTILVETIAVMLEQKPPQQKLTSNDEAVQYLLSNFSKSEFDNALKRQADIVFKEYMETIDPQVTSLEPSAQVS